MKRFLPWRDIVQSFSWHEFQGPNHEFSIRTVSHIVLCPGIWSSRRIIWIAKRGLKMTSQNSILFACIPETMTKTKLESVLKIVNGDSCDVIFGLPKLSKLWYVPFTFLIGTGTSNPLEARWRIISFWAMKKSPSWNPNWKSLFQNLSL